MPSMCDSSQSSSPSLINKLRQFRFQKKQLTSRATPSSSNSSQNNDLQLTPVSSRKEVDVIPETPESEKPINSCNNFSDNEVKNGISCESPRSEKLDTHSTTISNSENVSLSILQKRPKSTCNEINDDSEQNDSVNNWFKKRKYSEIDSEFLTDKERSLRVLMDTFPYADIMEMQDILVSCQWDIEKATARIKPNTEQDTLNQMKKKLTNTQHSVPTDNVKKSNIHAPIIKDSEDESDDGWLSKTTAMRTYGRNSTKKNYSNAKPVISDESDVEKKSEDNKNTSVSDNSWFNQNCETFDDLFQLKVEPENNSESVNNIVKKKKKIIPMRESSDDDDTPHVRTPLKKPMHLQKRKKIKKIRADSDDDDIGDYQQENVYDSDNSDDNDDVLTPARASVLNFFQEATSEELISVPGCSKKKVDIIVGLRPFSGWMDLVNKFESNKYITPDLLNGARTLINTREAVIKLMQRCQRISEESGKMIEYLMEGRGDEIEGYISQQPSLLNNRLHLAPYQLLGLNWLVLMHKKHINGILADEMGLGKTIQAIAFLAQIKEKGEEGPFLIIVPSSTIDNWLRELRLWLPSASVLCYRGPQDERRLLRHQILNDEVDDFDVLVTTYALVTSSAEDRSLFKHLDFHYVIFDEAHMLKNMRTQRYQNLMRIRAKRRLLLTGTPLQNNLSELMSLLIFVMPDMFLGKIDQVKQVFSTACKTEDNRSNFERERIEQAKRIMKPFVLRRLKCDVLKQLPAKHDEVKLCPMAEAQYKEYTNLVAELSSKVKKSTEEKVHTNGIGMMMELRKLANHPLLIRRLYTEDKLQQMAKLMLKEPTHCDANPELILEDMLPMSDFQLHKLCHQYKTVSSFKLSPETIVSSGKFQMLDSFIPELKQNGDRILLFSQFTIMLDILEEYMNIRNYRFLRMDGSIPVADRQPLIDEFNETPEILVFLLSTRAGGLGINLTAANVVVIHDIDFNPYNDKQAEDRCHRVGQTREVRVIRMISEKTIEENILRCAQDKLKLERDITADNEESEDPVSVDKLLRSALGL
ncbi:SWI/SNF-related matrix-associated actin-dependent regulator of chromatin subfamily A containing DEAD/H box 1-like isoform X2 [Centruroides sculpturatus]|uniref:SWI/SNF-related matrix-associated actin-dependent regulator of chromatin subfamily A containing DEAD/H box 1-like isoform X2 n=3 Tax=Centruroides sculpturatus TaxID=218467 RepID=UPI000C6CCF1D|nr:SWI/SNF-related matrix-associated actin-dependent regulator of chromatin subfamily A containing DEAD/H box 1-like isoform X2 [Centruroides sculpturatus]